MQRGETKQHKTGKVTRAAIDLDDVADSQQSADTDVLPEKKP